MTALKTVQFSFPTLASITNNTLTNFTQISLYLPETGTKTFRSVVAKFTGNDTITGTGGTITTKTMALQLASAGYSTVTNSNTYTNSGENLAVFLCQDYTAYFNTNWSGSNMTCDFRVQINQTTGSGTGLVDGTLVLDVTYEYDETSTTHVKTVWLPLNAPVGALTTSKPGTATATIPALDTYLPESSKTIRQMFITVQGNNGRTTTTDCTLSIEIDSTGVQTSGNNEGALNTARWTKLIFDVGSMDTSATRGFYIWASLAQFHHQQVWLTVTYEFDASASTSIFQSLMLPMELASPMGGTTSSDYQRGTREFWIEEPTTITGGEIAFFGHWDQAAAIAGLNWRVGTGSFVTYTDVAATVAGGNGCMVRNDSAFTLARGRNTLQVDVYRTDTADLGFNLCGFWIVNYTSGKHADGVHVHNKTVLWNLSRTGTGVANVLNTISATAPTIPAANYYLSALGTQYQYVSNTSGLAAGVTVLAEKTTGEGGVEWLPAYVDIGYTDAETGLRTCYSQIRHYFKRWAGDPDSDRLDIETSRRWRTVLANNCASWDTLDLIFTYHAITFDITGTISESAGGTVEITAHREASGEKIGETSRSGNGSYTITWYDDTEPVYAAAYESGTKKGRSDNDVAV